MTHIVTHIVVVYFQDGRIDTFWHSSLANARVALSLMLDKTTVRRVVVARIQNNIDKGLT